MVNLFFEIKRNSPTQFQKTLKISDPDLPSSLAHLYKSHSDEAIQRLIEVFFERSGSDGVKQFKAAIKSTDIKNSQQTDQQKADKAAPRYYRGALIED